MSQGSKLSYEQIQVPEGLNKASPMHCIVHLYFQSSDGSLSQ